MAIGDLKDILHRIRVKLYPNYLTHTTGGASGDPWLARTENEKTLTVEDVCTTLKNRGGYEGKYADLVDTVMQFLDETAYQLADGYAVSLKYFGIHPNVGGTYKGEHDPHDAKKHPVTFRFRTLKEMREIAEKIVVDITGYADVQGYIDEYVDVDISEESVNTIFIPGNQFIINGSKIKGINTAGLRQHSCRALHPPPTNLRFEAAFRGRAAGVLNPF
jgi:hypothetical protein